MKSIQTIRTAVLAVLIAAPFTSQAATITDLGPLPTVASAVKANPTTTNFGSTSTPPRGAQAYYENITGNQIGDPGLTVAVDPWGNTPLSGVATYSSVSGNSFAIFGFGKLQDSLSLVWGTADSYNELHFLKNGSVVDTVTGTDVRNVTNKSNNFILLSDVTFDGLKFTSGSTNAFEFANVHATPVPLPAAGWMLIAGLGALGAAARKRRATA
jgi:hypothetical protein